jgi:hypothetical protein
MRIASSRRTIVRGVTLELILETTKKWIAMGNVTVIRVFTGRRFQTGTKFTTSSINAGIGGTDIVVVTDEDSGVVAASCGIAESFSTFGG